MEKRIDLGYDGAAAAARRACCSTATRRCSRSWCATCWTTRINYTPSSAEQPGVITARVLADPFGQVLVLQVEDSGPGIPAAERELVFQPFYRVLGTNADGSGLGLPIVLEIARQHGASGQPGRRASRPGAARRALQRALRAVELPT